MSTEDEKMLDFVEFVTDKFATNQEPWKYSRDLGHLKHLRFEGDYTGYNHWKKRLRRFATRVTVRYWKPEGIWRAVKGSSRSFESGLWRFRAGGE